MSAKAYDKKTAAFAGYVIQNIPAGLTDEVMDGWMNNPAAMKRLLAGLASPKTEAPAKRKPLLTVVATTNLGAIASKETAACCTRLCYDEHRYDELNRRLDKVQLHTKGCTISTCAPAVRGWTWVEAAWSLPNIRQNATSITRLDRALLIYGYTITLSQIEDLIERTERGENTGLGGKVTNAFCFMQQRNGGDTVVVGEIMHNNLSGSWGINITGFDFYALDRSPQYNSQFLDIDYRLLIPNLDASKL